MEPYHNSAVVFGDLKDALLHYQHVVPMNFTGQFMGLRPNAAPSEVDVPKYKGVIEKFNNADMDDYRDLQEAFGDPDRLRGLYPPHLAEVSDLAATINQFDGLLFSHMVKVAMGDDAYEEYAKNLFEIVGGQEPPMIGESLPSFVELQYFFTAIMKSHDLWRLPIDCSQFYLDAGGDAPPVNALDAQNVEVVDTSKVGFSQIMELRDDPAIMKKMRSFRLFAYQTYSGMNKSFIEDDIQKRYDDYLDAIRESGLSTTTKVLSSLMNSKLLLGSLSTGVAAALLGDPGLAVSAFSSGAVLELGKLTLVYSKEKQELAKICNENPISYVAEVRQSLDSVRSEQKRGQT
jgi:hypothetical protein